MRVNSLHFIILSIKRKWTHTCWAPLIHTHSHQKIFHFCLGVWYFAWHTLTIQNWLRMIVHKKVGKVYWCWRVVHSNVWRSSDDTGEVGERSAGLHSSSQSEVGPLSDGESPAAPGRLSADDLLAHHTLRYCRSLCQHTHWAVFVFKVTLFNISWSVWLLFVTNIEKI